MKIVNGKLCILSVAVLCLVIGTSAEETCQEKPRNKLFEQSFGMGLTADDLLNSMMQPWSFPRLNDYFRPWRQLSALSRDVGSTIKSDKDKFQVNLDVQHFSPDEISVKTVDGFVVIEAKHEEKEDEHGYVSRQFVRRYALPEGAEADDVISELSSDGILTVTAPRKLIELKGERTVPIRKTGPVRVEANEGTCQSSDKPCN